ncbi:MAG TPA: hypothetical protein VK890_10355 [Bacteroidia bacterium]|jgi:hypothetical protein|nr:hypothetical protein [Bacteroidia bacterium]
MNKSIKAMLFIALIVGCNTSYVNAQTARGEVLASCSIGYTNTATTTSYSQVNSSNSQYNTNPPDGNSSTLGIGVNAGYFIGDGIVTGLSFSYTNTITLETQQNYNTLIYYNWNYTNHSISPGLFATKYFFVVDKFYIYTGITSSYTSGVINNSYLYNNGFSAGPSMVVPFPAEPTTGFNFVFFPGLAYFPWVHWAISFKLNNFLNYASTTVKDIPITFGSPNSNSIVTENKTTNTFNVGVGLVPTLGVSYVFQYIIYN